MKSYELVIERRQPPCGGKQSKLYDFRNVETDDPVAYVRANEPGLPEDTQFEIDGSADDVLTVQFVSGIQPVTYEFSIS